MDKAGSEEIVEGWIQLDLFPTTFPPVPKRDSNSASEVARDLPDYRIVKSKRRTRGVSAYRQAGVIEIHVPARMSKREITAIIPEMIDLILARESRERRSDSELAERAGQLLARYLPEFHESPRGLTWRKMSERWGSCTTADGTIRISDRLFAAPELVIDYVLFHELIHLRHADHGPGFTALLARFEGRELAEAFLEGYELGARNGS